METRILFLDDSGKPDPNHASGAVVLAGLAMDSSLYPSFSRRIQGAKASFYPTRGAPQDWEIKSDRIVKPVLWRRRKTKRFVQELIRIATTVDVSVYSATISKTRMIQALTLTTTMPLQLQRLVEHFDAECRTLGRMGMIVSDWSTHNLDQHASKCVGSYVRSRNIAMHPCIYYASSHGNEAIQVADLIAAVRRRTEEADSAMVTLDAQFHSVRPHRVLMPTWSGRAHTNAIRVI